MGIFTDEASNVQVQAYFPGNVAQVTNGDETSLILKFQNKGTGNFTIVDASASYHDPLKAWKTMRNTTAKRYNVNLPPGANFSVPFGVHSEFKPRDLGLTVWANVQDVQQDTHRLVAYNSTVSVIEPEKSWFDLSSLFVYIIVFAILGAAGSLGYKYVEQTYFPQPKRSKKSGKTPVMSARKTSDKPYPDSVKPYEEEWVPSHHLARGTSSSGGRKRVNAGKMAAAGERESGDVTSGGEGVVSGAESGNDSRKKGKKGKKQ